MKKKDFSIIENPQIRIPTIDSGKLKYNRTDMIGFIEIDITNLREKTRCFRKQNLNFSFTSCMIKIIGDCIATNKFVQAALISDKKLVIFDDVDISFSIERKVNDMYFPFPLIIRSANKKTVFEIDSEIKSASEKAIVDGTDLFMAEHPLLGKLFLTLFYLIPSKFRVLLMQRTIKSPFRAKKILGTVGFNTVNMAGRLSGWVFPNKNPYSLYIALGSITKKPLVINNEIKIREVLNMTIIFDHNIIDGTPARNFINKLTSVIEKGEFEI